MKIRFHIILAFLTITLLLSTSCQNSEPHKPIITVSIQPQKHLLEKIVGDKFNVICLLSNGSNPETYEPSMTHLMNLEKSKAYFCIGNIGFEMAIVDKAKKNNPDLKIFKNNENIKLIHGSHAGLASSHLGHHHHSHEIDPHIWTSAVNAKIIAQNMCNALCEIDPENKSYFQNNLNTLINEINVLHNELSAQLKSAEGEAFIVWHPSLSYFARDYNLRQISIEFEGKEIPAKYLKEEIDTAKAHNARVFFFQKEFDSRQAESVSNEIGTKLVTINPMNYHWDIELKNIANALTSTENN